MSAGRLRFFPPTSAKKERDEELALFRELFKREREKNMNLLESVSTELEPAAAVGMRGLKLAGQVAESLSRRL